MDPDLGGVDADHLLALLGAPDMGSEAGDAGDRQQLRLSVVVVRTDFGGGSARDGVPVDQQIALLEGREQRLAEARHDGRPTITTTAKVA